MNSGRSNDSRMVIFADLDNTLFQTLPKRNVPGLVVAGLGPDRQPLSFACPKQQKLLGCLMREGIVIPTTARGYESFNRVQLDFNSFVILNFGATVLNPDRTLNEEWHNKMASEAAARRPVLLEQFEAIRQFDSSRALGLRISVVADFGEDWYILAKHSGHNAPALDVLHQALVRETPPGFAVHRNDNNLTLSPDFFDKAHAVEFVIQRYFDAEKDVFLGMGDSLSDFDFMSSCDFLMLPSSSQLHAAFPSKK